MHCARGVIGEVVLVGSTRSRTQPVDVKLCPCTSSIYYKVRRNGDLLKVATIRIAQRTRNRTRKGTIIPSTRPIIVATSFTVSILGAVAFEAIH